MLGPIGSEIMGIFRLLSPQEIDRYIIHEEETGVHSAMPMAANGESFQFEDKQPETPHSNQKKKFPKDHSAEIIPLKAEINTNQKINSSEVDNEETYAPEKIEKIKTLHDNTSEGLESVGILSAHTIREQEAKRLKEENNKKDSTTVFLLKEREKSRQSKRRITEMYALKSYQSTANQEFSSDYEIDEDGNRVSDSLKGILLNKRQS